MQHKEEAESLPGVHCIKAGRGFFFYGAVQRQAAGDRGVPPIKGEAGFIDSAAGYEYVRSPTEYKNKIYPPPHAGTCRKNWQVPQNKNDIKYIPVRK